MVYDSLPFGGEKKLILPVHGTSVSVLPLINFSFLKNNNFLEENSFLVSK